MKVKLIKVTIRFHIEYILNNSNWIKVFSHIQLSEWYVYLFCVDFISNRICITRFIKIMSISFSRTYRYLFPLFPISFRHIEFRGDNLWIFVHLPDSFNIYAWLAQIIHFNTIIVSSFEKNKSRRYQLSKVFEICVFVYLTSTTIT